MQLRRVALCLTTIALFFPGRAQAQRAGDNAVASAQDAFGTTVGNETIGLYGPTSARGFSPVKAGNIRLDGLFFFQPTAVASQVGLDSRLSAGSTVRVGLTAQSYPFPAPTGIADFRLRLPGEKAVTSVVTTYGPYETYKAEVDAQVPLVDGKLGWVVGAGGGMETRQFPNDNDYWSFGTLMRWQPTENLELIPFFGKSRKFDWETFPYMAPAGPYLPPQVKRRARFNQPWADWDVRDTNYGALGHFNMSADWTLRAGVFRSVNARPTSVNLLFQNMQRDGTSDAYIVRYPSESNAATSGELRLSGRQSLGEWRNTFHVAMRGYTSRRMYGGAIPTFLGKATVGVYEELPEPPRVFGPQGRDNTRRADVGATYIGSWSDSGELSVGLQKTFYRRTFYPPGSPEATSRTQPWIYNGTIALFATKDMTVYGSYARGLEDPDVAPESADNRGQALAANITEQFDGGIRYRLLSRVTLVVGVFEVKKPYSDRNAVNIYTTVGSITHRGVELSLTGQPADGLRVVGGAVLLRPRISGFTVEHGLIRSTPPGISQTNLNLNIQYTRPSWRGLSLDAQVAYDSAQQANRLNTFQNPAHTIIDVGARLPLKVNSYPASLRLQVLNLTNQYVWTISGASGLIMNGANARNYLARLSVDF
jgi:iron complex outermembrane recepter protein